MSTQKASPIPHYRNIARATGVISLGTLFSRILGFLRDMIIARFFGVSIAAQAFVVAFRIPNLFRDMLAEGAANAAFVPVFSEYDLSKHKEEFWELANVVLNLLVVALSLVVVVGIASAGVIVPLIAPGFVTSAEKLSLTIDLTRMMFPYLFLVSLAAYAMAILNSLRHFSVPAFAPCFLNMAIIVCALIFGRDIRGLAFGVLIGGFLQLGVHIPVLYRKGFRPHKFMRRFSHPRARVIAGLLLPRIASSCIYQLNAFIDTIFGSLAWIVGSGGVAILYYAYRLILLPLGLFSTSLSQAALPDFSRQATEENLERLRETLSWALRVTFVLLLPAAVGMVVLAEPLITTVFGGGRFGPYAAHTTALALIFYAAGLPFFGANRILQSCFFSLKDTATPARVAGIALISNVILNLLLIYPLKIGGIALATSLSGFSSFLLLSFFLRKKIGGGGYSGKVGSSLLRALLAAAGMGGICYYLMPVWFASEGALQRAAILTGIIGSGFGGYLALCKLLRIDELDALFRWMKRPAARMERR